jgi:hypothetical protein
MLNFTLAALALSSLLALNVLPSAAQGNANAQPDKGAEVTIQGCVVAGESPGTFVFTRVRVWPVIAVMGQYGPRHYWFDKTPEELGGYVGQTLQISGTVVEAEESEVERSPGLEGGNKGSRVAIELPGRDVVTTPGNAGVPLADSASKVDMKITLLKVHVDKMLVVLKGCLPQ